MANDDSVTTAYNTAVAVNVLANDSDPDGDSLSVVSLGDPPNGSATLSGGNVVYTPDSGFVGSDSFGYTISDGNGGTDTAAVNVTVNAPTGPTIHVADLDPTPTLQKRAWTARARILVHTGTHSTSSGVVVTGTFSTGQTLSCTTNSRGLCSLSVSGLSKTAVLSVVFTVTNLSRSGYTYYPSANHDPESDSDGTTLVINRP